MSDTKSGTPNPPPPRPPKADEDSEPRPALVSNELLIGRSIIGSGSPAPKAHR